MYRNSQGIGVLTQEGKIVEEVDTFTCAHLPCQRIVDVPAKAKPEDMGSMCKICMKMVCKYCAIKECTLWRRGFNKMNARQKALRSYGVDN